MEQFFEVQSNAFKTTINSDIITSYKKENNTTTKKNFNETYLKNYLYYDKETGGWNNREKSNTTFKDEVLETSVLNPLGQNVGFIGFGGYSLNKLPARGEQWGNSNSFTVENSILLNLTYTDGRKTWLKMDIDNNQVEDLLYGITYIEAFNIQNVDEVDYIAFNSDFLTIFNETLPSLEITKLSSEVLVDISEPWENKGELWVSARVPTMPEGQSVLFMSKYPALLADSVIMFSQNAGPRPFQITWGKVMGYDLFLTQDYVYQVNIITEISEDLINLLDIPNYINNQEVNGLSLISNQINVNQIILPTNNLFSLAKNQFLTNGNFTSLRLIRSYLNSNYNLTDNNAIIEENSVDKGQFFILNEKGLFKSGLSTLDNIASSYEIIYYGEQSLSGSKIRNFSIRENDIYPYNNINYAIENTPYLQYYTGSITENNITYSDTKGVLKANKNNTYLIKSISSGFLNNLIETTSNEVESGRILRLSTLYNNLKTQLEIDTEASIDLENNCLMSAIDSIHTLILDELNTNKLSLSAAALNLGRRSKIKTLIINTNNLFYKEDVEPKIEFSNNCSIIFNKFTNLNLSYFNFIDTNKCSKMQLLSSKGPQLVNTNNLQELYCDTTELELTEDKQLRYTAINIGLNFALNNTASITLSGIWSGSFKEQTGILTYYNNINKLNIVDMCKSKTQQTLDSFTDLQELSVSSNQISTFLNSTLTFSQLTTLNYYLLPTTTNSLIGIDISLSTIAPNLTTLNIIPYNWYTQLEITENDIGKVYYYGSNKYYNGVRKESVSTPDENIYYTKQIIIADYIDAKLDSEDYPGAWYQLHHFGDKLPENLGYYPNIIGKERFLNMNNLRNIYIPEDFVKYNDRLEERCFYGTTPKNLYIYISQADDFLNQNLNLSDFAALLGWEKDNKFIKNEGNILPYNSKIYLYNLNAITPAYKIKEVGTYTTQKEQSKKIKDLQLWKYGDIENWGNFVNNDEE